MQVRGKWSSRVAGTLATFLALVACSQDNQVSKDLGPVAGASAARLSELQLKENSAAGLDGNPQAAFLVHMHYQMAMLDKVNGELWARIAAENGSIAGIAEYADYLLEMPDEANCRRARFWARRAEQLARSDDDRATAKSAVLGVSESCKENAKSD